jgi:glutamate N-acetyltransferase/amino-acid N-acetyltransferase
MAAQYDQDQARAAMAGGEVTITVDLHLNDGQATAWGCDLTHGYIDENTMYTR